MNYKRKPLIYRSVLAVLALLASLPAMAAPAERGDLAFFGENPTA